MSLNRLVGSDGELWAYTFAATPAVTAVAGSEYKITGIDAVASTLGTGYKIGDLWVCPKTPPTLGTGDKIVLATPKLVGEITSFKFTFSKDAIEVTTLADLVKVYRAGKSDVTGTIEGITFVDSLADGSSIANRFIRIANIASDGSVTLNQLDGSDLFVKCFLQKDDSDGETQIWLAAQVELLGYDFGAATSDAQSWSSDTRMLTSPIIFTKATPTT